MQRMQRMERIRAVLFDMDGTLIDTECHYRVCWPKALAEFGYHMTDEQALAMRSLGRPFAPARLREWFGEELDYAAVRARRKELMEEILAREGVRVKPGAREILKFLCGRRITTAVVTATDGERADRYLKQTGLSPFVDRVISAAQVREGKPSPDVYLFACERLGLSPAECYAVEDSPNGILSAFRAGCKVIMAPDQTEPDGELERCLYAKVDTLRDIQNLLLQNLPIDSILE